MTYHAEPNKWFITAAVVSGTVCIGLTMSMMHLAIPLMIPALHTDIDTTNVPSVPPQSCMF